MRLNSSRESKQRQQKRESSICGCISPSVHTLVDRHLYSPSPSSLQSSRQLWPHRIACYVRLLIFSTSFIGTNLAPPSLLLLLALERLRRLLCGRGIRLLLSLESQVLVSHLLGCLLGCLQGLGLATIATWLCGVRQVRRGRRRDERAVARSGCGGRGEWDQSILATRQG